MSRMRGQQVLMECLLAEGVDTIFGNPGSTESGVMDALQDYPQIKYYLALHESVAMAMGSGYAQVARKPCLVSVHSAAGTANTTGMLFNALKGRIPLVVTAGQQYTSTLAYEPIMGVDIAELVRPTTKWAVQVEKRADLAMILRRAFKVAYTPPRGPVYVAIPADLLVGEGETEIGPSQRLHTHLSPDPQAVQRARELLLEAERPALVVGDGVAQAGAMPEAVKVAELLGARVFTYHASELNFPTAHPLFSGDLNNLDDAAMRQQLAGADVILAVGTRMFTLMFPPSGPVLTAETKVIHLDIDTWEIGKNYPVTVGMWADPGMGLRAIADAVEERLSDAMRQKIRQRAETCREAAMQVREQAEARKRQGWDNTPTSDGRLLEEIRAVLPAGALVSDGGLSVRLSALGFTEPGSYFRLPNGSCLGWALGGALGMKVARPERPVLAFVGDGELMYSIQALWTAAHYGIPVTCIVYNNRAYQALKRLMNRFLQLSGMPERRSAYIGMDIDEPLLDFARIAQAFGVWGVRVRDPKDLRPALEAAFGLGRPAVVDVDVSGASDKG